VSVVSSQMWVEPLPSSCTALAIREADGKALMVTGLA
jgi:hypothetical protein